MMKDRFDVIIVGGSYSGLSAAMALGRSMKQVLIIDSGLPCNRQTPYSHNFLTHDGKEPKEILRLAKDQVAAYPTIQFYDGVANYGGRTPDGFEVGTDSGKTFFSSKLIFATGIRDVMPDIPGFAECWGISVLHCPYCHGYEVRDLKTGILGNGDYGFEFSLLISNWTRHVTLFTYGPSTLNGDQTRKLKESQITIVESPIDKLQHTNGHLESIVFKDGSRWVVEALYARCAFEQHCDIPVALGCQLTEDGYIKTDSFQKTSVPGVFACGDNVTRMRTVANAVAMGTTAGIAVNKEIVFEPVTAWAD